MTHISRPALSIVVPAYNEEARLAKTLMTIQTYLQKREDSYEVIVVSDGSSDNTVGLARRFAEQGLNIRVLHNKRNRGKGASIRRGVAASRGARVLFTDADLSTPIQELEKLEAAMQQGADVAIASRALQGAAVTVRQPFYREMMGKTFNRFARLITLSGIHDTQCGFKLFTRKIARDIFRRMTIKGFGFDVEILYLARQSQAQIVEVPVIWNNVMDSKVSPIADSFQMFVDLFLIRMRHFKKNRKIS
ncbi:glycosyltransferase family 2 protein [bacterium]|nr:glycosyltransferase family 2 protein [bacterium]